jgi:hypothetical protein
MDHAGITFSSVPPVARAFLNQGPIEKTKGKTLVCLVEPTDYYIIGGDVGSQDSAI